MTFQGGFMAIKCQSVCSWRNSGHSGHPRPCTRPASSRCPSNCGQREGDKEMKQPVVPISERESACQASTAIRQRSVLFRGRHSPGLRATAVARLQPSRPQSTPHAGKFSRPRAASRPRLQLDPKAGLRAKVYNGSVHPDCGGPVQWPGNGGLQALEYVGTVCRS